MMQKNLLSITEEYFNYMVKQLLILFTINILFCTSLFDMYNESGPLNGYERYIILNENEKVRIRKNDTVFSLQKRILKEEHKIYPKAISKILN